MTICALKHSDSPIDPGQGYQPSLYHVVGLPKFRSPSIAIASRSEWKLVRSLEDIDSVRRVFFSILIFWFLPAIASAVTVALTHRMLADERKRCWDRRRKLNSESLCLRVCLDILIVSPIAVDVNMRVEMDVCMSVYQEVRLLPVGWVLISRDCLG